MFIIGLIIPIISFFLQAWPRFKNRYFGIDTWRHLMFADYVRRHKKLPTEIKDRYVVTGPFNYPPVIILFLSLFPKSFIDKYQFVVSPLFESLNNYLLFLATYLLTDSILTAIIAQIIAALVPIIVIEASNLSTRILSNLIYAISLFSLLYFDYTHDLIWLFIAAAFLFILFFTHKLALQAYLFTVICLSLLERNPFYILFFMTIFLLVFNFGGNLYRIILRDHIAILNYWRINIDLRFAHMFRGIPEKNDALDFVGRLYLLSVKNPYVYILGNNPWIAVLIGIFLLHTFGLISLQSNIPQPMFTKLVYWIVGGLVATVVISAIKPLRFLGEGQRYIEYCVFPMAILLGDYAAHFYTQRGRLFLLTFGIITTIILIAILYIQKKTVLQDTSRTITPGLWNIIHYLNEQEGKSTRLAVFPFQMGDALMYFIKGRVLTTDSIVGLIKLNDVFPILTKPLVDIIKKYKVNYVLFQKDYVTFKELKLKKYTIIKDEGGFVLVKV